MKYIWLWWNESDFSLPLAEHWNNWRYWLSWLFFPISAPVGILYFWYSYRNFPEDDKSIWGKYAKVKK